MNQEPMSRSLQLPYQAYVTALLQTDLFLVAVTSISVLWFIMALPRESHSR